MLSDLDIAVVAESRLSFAERLSQWLDLGDAISLSGALKAGAAKGAESPADGIAIQTEFARVRAAMIEMIGPEDVQLAIDGRTRFPIPGNGAADYSPYHRYYLARQRDLDGGIGPLRANVRAALSAISPRLRQLAAMDAVFESALRNRERNLLMTVPLLLERRFEALRRSCLASLAETQAADNPANRTGQGGWLAMFYQDMRSLLLAELDFRLQPVEGLIEALGNEVTKHP